MIVVLPYPVSANRYWRTVVAKKQLRALTFVSDEAKSYKAECAWRAKAAGFRAPLAGAEVKGTLSSSRCEAKGSSDIRRVVFWLDGNIQLNTETSSPWNCLVDTTKYQDGAHKLKAVAYDRNGASTAAPTCGFSKGSRATSGVPAAPKCRRH